jgi:hypothetical protein
LGRVVRNAIADHAAMLLVRGTTAEAWVRRAAMLHGCPTVEIDPVDSNQRDSLLVDLSDRLYVLRARRQGLISKLVRRRLQCSTAERDCGRVWVTVGADDDDGGADLVRWGAVGWYTLGSHLGHQTRIAAEVTGADQPTKKLPQHCCRGDGPIAEHEYLIHCTRGRDGPWPGQSIDRWRDELLLGRSHQIHFGPGDVLARIVRQRLLVPRPLRSGSEPVVCLSEVPLRELLGRRTFRPHLGRWDYEPYGIGVRRNRIEQMGGMPVVYHSSTSSESNGKVASWRLQPSGKTYDWTAEREWRVCGPLDLGNFARDDLFVFAGDQQTVDHIQQISPWPVLLVQTERCDHNASPR